MVGSASSVGRVFAIAGAALAGGAVGMLAERGDWFSVGTPNSHATYRWDTGSGDASGTHSPFLVRLTSKGLPSDERLRYYKGFVSSLNYERRIPNWVLEYFPGTETARGANDNEVDTQMKGQRGSMRFFADTTVPEPFRVHPKDYVGSERAQHLRGLSRGHLAAAQFHKGSPGELLQTFNMNANTVPQDMTMNAVDWLRLENLTRKLRRHYEGGLWVVTGPVFHPRLVDGELRTWGWTDPSDGLSSTKSGCGETASTVWSNQRRGGAAAVHPHKVVCYELVGDRDVAVPTHLFKVILGERADGTHEAAAFLMPNRAIDVEQPLTAYQVPAATVERLTGLEFFRNVTTTEPDARLREKGLDALPGICERVACEARTTGMFRSYRDVARLRKTSSLAEVQHVYSELLMEQQKKGCKGVGGTVLLNEDVAQEYRERLKELAGTTSGDGA